jgi:hypothetical protein
MSDLMRGTVEDRPELMRPLPGGREVGLSPAIVNKLIKNRRLDMIRMPGCRPLIDVNQLRRLVAESRTPALYGSGDPGFRS